MNIGVSFIYFFCFGRTVLMYNSYIYKNCQHSIKLVASKLNMSIGTSLGYFSDLPKFHAFLRSTWCPLVLYGTLSVILACELKNGMLEKSEKYYGCSGIQLS